MHHRPITVCHPVWRMQRGGLETQLAYLVTDTSPDEVKHIIVARGASHDDELVLRLPANVQLVREPSLGPDPLISHRLALTLRQHRADILHVRGLSMLLDAVMAAHLCQNVSVAFSFHGFESSSVNWSSIRRKLYREAILHCDDCWAVSRSAAKGLARELNLSEDIFGVVPNGVDATRFTPEQDQTRIRQQFGLPLDRLIVLCLGNLKPAKGHEVLIDAIGRLGQQAARMTFLLVGRDYLNHEMQRRAAANCPNADVRFVGAREDAVPWYQAADLYVQPSHWEGSSNALLEAMSTGLPIIATNVGGNRDAITSDTGLLVPPNDSDALAQAINDLATDPTRRFCLGRAARQRIEALYSLSSAQAVCIDRYKRLLRPSELNQEMRVPIAGHE